MTRLLAALSLLVALPAFAADDAAQLFASKCVSCHGKDGKGTPSGQKLGAPDLTKAKETKADMAKVISDGKGKMMAYKGKLTPEQIDALAAYVKNGLK